MIQNIQKIGEKLIEISKAKPLFPETFIDWSDKITNDTKFMPEYMISLQGHKLWDKLTQEQKTELGRLEMVQVMYSYAWSETLACLFLNRHLITLSPESVEYRFIIREIIEEFRHQEMFGMAIRKLDRTPIKANFIQSLIARITVKYMPSPLVFFSVLSVELMADCYAKHIRQDPKIYSILRKSSALHHIEEGRHIFYTKLLLKKYLDKAGFFKKCLYSTIILLNIYFMRTLYVKKTFFKNLNVTNPYLYWKAALQNYKNKFSSVASEVAVDFVKSFGGFNFITKPLWKWILKVEI